MMTFCVLVPFLFFSPLPLQHPMSTTDREMIQHKNIHLFSLLGVVYNPECQNLFSTFSGINLKLLLRHILEVPIYQWQHMNTTWWSNFECLSFKLCWNVMSQSHHLSLVGLWNRILTHCLPRGKRPNDAADKPELDSSLLDPSAGNCWNRTPLSTPAPALIMSVYAKLYLWCVIFLSEFLQVPTR